PVVGMSVRRAAWEAVTPPPAYSFLTGHFREATTELDKPCTRLSRKIFIRRTENSSERRPLRLCCGNDQAGYPRRNARSQARPCWVAHQRAGIFPVPPFGRIHRSARLE